MILVLPTQTPSDEWALKILKYKCTEEIIFTITVLLLHLSYKQSDLKDHIMSSLRDSSSTFWNIQDLKEVSNVCF